MNDDEFLEAISDDLAALPGVRAVALGGSRTQGFARPDSDWDFALYYRDGFEPDDLRSLGWRGEATELGGWGGGVFNGGGWFRVHDRAMDVHYRDLDVVDRVLAEIERGEFGIEALMFHQAGIPTYLLAAELAVNVATRGELPHPSYPEQLREKAPAVWWERAEQTFHYARAGHAPAGRIAQTAGLISEAACEAAHAVLASRGVWITNEKQLLTKAGLRGVDQIVAGMTEEPVALVASVNAAQAMCAAAVGA